MEGSKRKRAGNWVEEDKTLLKELVKEKVSVIENKNTDTNSNQKKKKAWLEIEECFNNLCHGVTRNVSQLKSQWTITKIQAKKVHATFRREISQTGGGPKPPEMVLAADDISVWLPNEFIIDNNEFDSDTIVYERNLSKSEENLSCSNKKAEGELVTSIPDIIELPDEQVKAVQENIKIKKKRLPVLSQNVANNNITKLADSELKNREELHMMQMENERKRSRNLDLEYEILQEKKKYFLKKKFNDND